MKSTTSNMKQVIYSLCDWMRVVTDVLLCRSRHLLLFSDHCKWSPSCSWITNLHQFYCTLLTIFVQQVLQNVVQLIFHDHIPPIIGLLKSPAKSFKWLKRVYLCSLTWWRRWALLKLFFVSAFPTTGPVSLWVHARSWKNELNSAKYHWTGECLYF